MYIYVAESSIAQPNKLRGDREVEISCYVVHDYHYNYSVFELRILDGLEMMACFLFKVIH